MFNLKSKLVIVVLLLSVSYSSCLDPNSNACWTEDCSQSAHKETGDDEVRMPLRRTLSVPSGDDMFDEEVNIADVDEEGKSPHLYANVEPEERPRNEAYSNSTEHLKQLKISYSSSVVKHGESFCYLLHD